MRSVPHLVVLFQKFALYPVINQVLTEHIPRQQELVIPLQMYWNSPMFLRVFYLLEKLELLERILMTGLKPFLVVS